MRLQLALACVLALAGAARAEPDVAAAARVSVYADSDHTSIVTSAVSASGNVVDGVRVDAQYLADAVSSASIDVVTSATGRIHDFRSELTAGVALGDAARSLRAGYIYSREHDWFSHSVLLAGAADFLQHNLTLGLGGTLGFNDIHRMGDAMFARSLTTYGLEATAAYTLTPRDLVLVGAGVGYLDGYQASPYRFAVYSDLRAVYELEPETRLRETLTLRWNRHLFTDSALRTSVRGYRDDWALLAITAEAEYVVGFGPLDVAGHVRAYRQRRARFYQAEYAAPQAYMTADRELATFTDVFAGARALYVLEVAEHALRLDLSADVFQFWFDDVPRLPRRHGVVISLGAGFAL